MSLVPTAEGITLCSVTSLGGFSAPVEFSCSGLSAISCDFEPSTVTPPPGGNANVDLNIDTDDSVPIGLSSFQVTGTSGSISDDFTVFLQVYFPSDMTCSPDTKSVSMSGSTNISCLISIVDLRFEPQIELSCNGEPDTVACDFNPNPIGNSQHFQFSTLTITTNDSEKGTYNFDIIATGGSSSTKSDSVSLIVSDIFEFDCPPNSFAIGQDSSAFSQCDVTFSDRFSGPVSISCSPDSVTMTCTVNPSPVNSPSSAGGVKGVDISIFTDGTSVGDHDVEVIASGGGLTIPVHLTAEVTDLAPDFSLDCSPDSILVDTTGGGGLQNTGVICTVNSLNGFSQPVDLTCSDAIPVTCAFLPNHITPARNGFVTSQFRLSNAGLPTGSFSLDIIGTSGSLVRTTTIFPSVSIFVIPESAYGSIALLLSSIVSFAAFMMLRARSKGKNGHPPPGFSDLGL